MSLTDRQKDAATDHSTSLCVTAGAGTGKTHVLVTRYINLIQDAGYRIPEILALTFTDKAAQEMKERVRTALSEKNGSDWNRAQEEFLWANISTFHSFCAGTIREFPIEGGVDPGFGVLEEADATALLEETLEDLIHGRLKEYNRQSMLNTLRTAGDRYLKVCLLELNQKRGDAEEFFRRLSNDESAVVASWENYIKDTQQTALNDLFASNAFVGALSDLLALAGQYAGDTDSGTRYLQEATPILREIQTKGKTPALCPAFLDLYRIKGSKNMGSKKVFSNADLETLRRSYSIVKESIKKQNTPLSLSFDPDSSQTSETLEFLQNLGTVFADFTRATDRAKEQIGSLDFNDLIYRTARIFREYPEQVRQHFRHRFKYIMVDEFQDTDPVQAGIILRIAEASNALIFVVGDPKQSIYLFRDADVSRFKETATQIQDHDGGREIALDINFRSTPEIISCGNYLFSQLLQDRGKEWDFAYHPINVSENRATHKGTVELLIPPKGEKAADSARIEADLVAQRIAELVGNEERHITVQDENGQTITRPLRYGDIAILFERRTKLNWFEWACKKWCIPYHVHAGTGFFERQEVFDLLSVLTFLMRDDDDISLAGALRSPYFGMSDAELFSIAQEQGTTLWQKLQRSESSSALNALEILNRWKTVCRREPVNLLIRRILQDSEIFAVYAALPGGEECLANIEKLVASSRDSGTGIIQSLESFVKKLHDAVTREQREGGAPPPASQDNRIIMMTVHASKGLEFPLVVVPGMAETGPSGGKQIFVDPVYGVAVKMPDPDHPFQKEIETPLFTALRHREDQKQKAEQRRLFYVALTRARDHLMLSGVRQNNLPDSLDSSSRRIDWVCSILQIDPASLPEIGMITRSYSHNGWDFEVEVRSSKKPNSLPPQLNPPEIIGFEKLPEGRREWIHEQSPAMELHGKIWTVSEILGKESEKHPGASSNTTWGTVVHQVFEGRNPARICTEAGMPDPEVEAELTGLYEQFCLSDKMQDVTEEYCELPFLTQIRGTPFKGTIDRLVKNSRGTWTLIDYKTGPEIETEEYIFQMAVYGKAAEQMLGVPVTTCLYSTQTGEYVNVSPEQRKRQLKRIPALISHLKTKK